MEASAFLFELIAAIAYLIVGVRLLRLAARTREQPERWLGTYFVATGVSYLLYEIPLVLSLEASWHTPLFFGGRIVYAVGLVPFVLFLRAVFHRGQRWADWVVGASLALLFAGVGISSWTGDYEGFSLTSPWFWCEWLGYTLPFVWLAVDSLVGYGRARRRLRIGLIDPVVANRYLLWGLFGATQCAISLALVAMYLEYAGSGVFSALADAAVGVLEMLSIGVLTLVFFAPDVYRRWLCDGPQDASAEGR